MITKIADNIISPLGASVDDNYAAIVQGRSCLSAYADRFGLPEPFCGSLLNRESIDDMFAAEVNADGDFSFFEKLCILSVTKALCQCRFAADAADVLFVVSTTKGNVDYLASDLTDERCYIARSAEKIARYFGNTNTLIVASNACISGVCAQIAAVRALLSGKYSYAIIVGSDVLSKFIVSGFQSFKALSPVPCKPYDKNRVGLNLGEAVGTMVLTTAESDDRAWQYIACSNHNDANHISGPSRTGEGSYRVLTDLLTAVDKEQLAFVNAHGTATAYNDEMESIAMHRAGLDEVPVNGLKGYYGHTLGAAGVIETILSMKAIDNGVVLPTRGYEEQGTSHKLNISDSVRPTDKTAFIKILSGFGGSNAGIAYRKGGSR